MVLPNRNQRTSPADPYVQIEAERVQREQQVSAVAQQKQFVEEKQRELGQLEQARLSAVENKKNKLASIFSKENQLDSEARTLSEDYQRQGAGSTPQSEERFKQAFAELQKKRAEINKEKQQIEESVTQSEQRLQTFSKQYLSPESQSELQKQITSQKEYLATEEQKNLTRRDLIAMSVAASNIGGKYGAEKEAEFAATVGLWNKDNAAKEKAANDLAYSNMPLIKAKREEAERLKVGQDVIPSTKNNIFGEAGVKSWGVTTLNPPSMKTEEVSGIVMEAVKTGATDLKYSWEAKEGETSRTLYTKVGGTAVAGEQLTDESGAIIIATGGEKVIKTIPSSFILTRSEESFYKPSIGTSTKIVTGNIFGNVKDTSTWGVTTLNAPDKGFLTLTEQEKQKAIFSGFTKEDTNITMPTGLAMAGERAGTPAQAVSNIMTMPLESVMQGRYVSGQEILERDIWMREFRTKQGVSKTQLAGEFIVSEAVGETLLFAPFVGSTIPIVGKVGTVLFGGLGAYQAGTVIANPTKRNIVSLGTTVGMYAAGIAAGKIYGSGRMLWEGRKTPVVGMGFEAQQGKPILMGTDATGADIFMFPSDVGAGGRVSNLPFGKVSNFFIGGKTYGAKYGDVEISAGNLNYKAVMEGSKGNKIITTGKSQTASNVVVSQKVSPTQELSLSNTDLLQSNVGSRSYGGGKTNIVKTPPSGKSTFTDLSRITEFGEGQGWFAETVFVGKTGKKADVVFKTGDKPDLTGSAWGKILPFKESTGVESGSGGGLVLKQKPPSADVVKLQMKPFTDTAGKIALEAKGLALKDYIKPDIRIQTTTKTTPITDTKQSTSTIIKQDTVLKTTQKQNIKQVTEFKFGSDLMFKPMTTTVLKQGQMTELKTDSKFDMSSLLKPPTKETPPIIVPVKPIIEIPPPFVVPFGGGLYGKKQPKTKLKKLKTSYAPSLTAAGFGITFKKTPKGIQKKTFTGLEFRPLLPAKKDNKLNKLLGLGRRK
jgi:hypothetical protein